MHLADIAPRQGPAWITHMGKAHMIERRIRQTRATKLGAEPREFLGIRALVDPGPAHIRQPGPQINICLRVGIGPRGVVNQDRRILFATHVGGRIAEADLTHRHANIRP